MPGYEANGAAHDITNTETITNSTRAKVTGQEKLTRAAQLRTSEKASNGNKIERERERERNCRATKEQHLDQPTTEGVEGERGREKGSFPTEDSGGGRRRRADDLPFLGRRRWELFWKRRAGERASAFCLRKKMKRKKKSRKIALIISFVFDFGPYAMYFVAI